MADNPFNKPERPGPDERPQPRPRPGGGTVTIPPAPTPTPAPRPPVPPPPVDDRNPVNKPVKEGEPPLPTTTSFRPIDERWQKEGGRRWAVLMIAPEPFGDVKGALFEVQGTGQRVSIVWRAHTGALLVGPRMFEAYSKHDVPGAPLGLPTSEEMPTHDQRGRYQNFDGGTVVWHPNIGAAAVTGAMYSAYAKVHGSHFGYPTGKQRSTPDGRAQVQEFVEVASGERRAIYWTPRHGAHAMSGPIGAAWHGYRGEASLGYPMSGVMNLGADGAWQRFENADYIWHRNWGAHELHWPLKDVYHRLGGSAWGFPTTDQTRSSDGRGLFAHFVHADSGEERSLYWSPDIGVRPVVGAIRQRWAELGWERGRLGYPTGEPQVHPIEADARSQAFQNGELVFVPSRNAVAASPAYFVQRIEDGNFAGQVELNVYLDGSYRFFGYVRSNAGLHGYDYLLSALFEPQQPAARAVPLPPLTFSWKGDVSSTHLGDEKDNFSDEGSNDVVRDNFWEYQAGALRVQENHRNGLLSTIGDVTEVLLRWTIGEQVFNPAMAGIFLAGSATIAKLTGGTWAGGLRFAGGIMWGQGPSGTLFALGGEAGARLATDEEPISEEDYDLACEVFQSSLPPRTDIILSNALGGEGRAFTFPRIDNKMVIHVGEWYKNPRDRRSGKYPQIGQLLVHELVHVWQYHNNAASIRYIGDAITEREYEPGQLLGRDWESFGMEQQGSIVDRWYARYHHLYGTNPTGLESQQAMNDSAFPFIRDNVRLGRN